MSQREVHPRGYQQRHFFWVVYHYLRHRGTHRIKTNGHAYTEYEIPSSGNFS